MEPTKSDLTKGLFAKPGPWMELNPDYRKPIPKTNTYCCRCQADLSALKKTGFKSVEVNYETLRVRENILQGNATIGLDCWKQVLKENKTNL